MGRVLDMCHTWLAQEYFVGVKEHIPNCLYWSSAVLLSKLLIQGSVGYLAQVNSFFHTLTPPKILFQTMRHLSVSSSFWLLHRCLWYQYATGQTSVDAPADCKHYPQHLLRSVWQRCLQSWGHEQDMCTQAGILILLPCIFGARNCLRYGLEIVGHDLQEKCAEDSWHHLLADGFPRIVLSSCSCTSAGSIQDEKPQYLVELAPDFQCFRTSQCGTWTIWTHTLQRGR